MIKLDDGTLVYDVKETSEKTHLCVDTIRAWCRSGRLKAQKIRKSYYMTEEAIKDAVEGKTLKR